MIAIPVINKKGEIIDQIDISQSLYDDIIKHSADQGITPQEYFSSLIDGAMNNTKSLKS